MAEPAIPPAQYQPADVTFRFLLCGAGVVLHHFALHVRGDGALPDSHAGSAPDHGVAPLYPPPRLQADPAADLQRFTAQELSRLNSAGWVDKTRGIVHIPINEAMRSIAAQGIPDWPVASGGEP